MRATNYPLLRDFRWRPWREATILALVVMELSWIVPWYRSLTPATYAVEPVRVFLVLGGIYVGVHLVVRLTNFLRVRMDIRRGILVALFIASILAGYKTLLYANEPVSFDELFTRPLRAFTDYTSLIPDEFVIALMALLVSWRAMMLSQEFIEPLTVRRKFQLGIIMFIAFVFFNTLVTGETPGPVIYLFFFSGLIALGAARIAVLTGLRGGRVNPFDRTWSIGMLLATLIVVGLAAVAESLVGEGMFIEQAGAVLLGALILLAVALISPAIYFLPLLANRIPFAQERVAEIFEGFERLRMTMMGAAARLFEFLENSGIINWSLYLKPILLWSVVIVAGLAILISLSRWLWKEGSREQDDRQILMTTADLLLLLKESVQDNMRRVGEGVAGLRRLRPGQQLLAAARIRRIYAELMALSEKLDRPRRSAQTPLEYLPALNQLFPDSLRELAIITQAYLRVRYGELPETRQEVKAVEHAWKQIRIQGQEQLSRGNTGAGKRSRSGGADVGDPFHNRFDRR